MEELFSFTDGEYVYEDGSVSFSLGSNGLVEKYKGLLLQKWIDKVPDVFYDEMNGFNFELEFTGTQLDFQDLKTAVFML